MITGLRGAQNGVKVFKHKLRLQGLIHDLDPIVFQLLNQIFMNSMTGLQMKELRISVTFLKESDARLLACDGSRERRNELCKSET
jgi:hypothetical protein